MSAPILSEGNFSVDSNIIKIGDTSYSVSSIGSVSLKKEENPLGCILVCIGLFISFIIGCSSNFIVGFIAFVVVIAALAQLNKSKISAATYKVMVKNSSGDQPILTTKDQDQALRLKSAIEEAIQRRP